MKTMLESTHPDYGLLFIARDAMNNSGWIKRDSRAGFTVEFESPVIVKNSRYYISSSPVRDANPFFHLAESLWMLAGRQDLDFLLIFNSTFGQFSDDGKFVRGSAYGYRWREFFGKNQIASIINELQNTASRRAVLTQWSVEDLNIDSKDVPCNTQTYFLVRNGKLDMTVVNRSNDLIYGMYGSNIVHFSILHEYIASALNIEKGDYYQMSNCLHIYTDNSVFQKMQSNYRADFSAPEVDNDLAGYCDNPYGSLVQAPIGDAVQFMSDLTEFFNKFDELRSTAPDRDALEDLGLALGQIRDTTSPLLQDFYHMGLAWISFKRKQKPIWLPNDGGTIWRFVSQNYLTRRNREILS